MLADVAIAFLVVAGIEVAHLLRVALLQVLDVDLTGLLQKGQIILALLLQAALKLLVLTLLFLFLPGGLLGIKPLLGGVEDAPESFAFIRMAFLEGLPLLVLNSFESGQLLLQLAVEYLLSLP
jgi:hypothetical protein